MDSEHGEYWSEPTPVELRPIETLEHPDLKATYEYWRRVKGERAMPARREISPKELRQALRTIHLYDVLEGGGDYRLRLIGTGVFPGLADDQTGKLLSEHPDPGIRLRFAGALNHVVANVAPVRSISLRKTGNMLHDAHTEGLWLPLGENGHVDHVLAQSALAVLEPGNEDFGA